MEVTDEQYEELAGALKAELQSYDDVTHDMLAQARSLLTTKDARYVGGVSKYSILHAQALALVVIATKMMEE